MLAEVFQWTSILSLAPRLSTSATIKTGVEVNSSASAIESSEKISLSVWSIMAGVDPLKRATW